MEIISNDKRFKVPISILRYQTFWKRFRGLMFRLSPIKDEGIFICPCNSIHMFFMFFPIDVVFLDEHHQVVKTIVHLKPWHVVRPVKHAVSAIELPSGTIHKYQIKTHDKIKL
ncbi:DUF192 domain-containing protein [Virgibacillus sp. MSP4-1]|nr:DUF192 domain-containing protein [Virgibacillus sp. MSP4-1]